MAFRARIKPGAFRMHMGGKSVKLANFDAEVREKVLNRLAEKDEVMNKGNAGILPGLKIDGKQVTRDNIKDFKVKEKPKKVKKLKIKLKKLMKPAKPKVTKPKKVKTVRVKAHKKDVIPGPGKIIKKIKSYRRRKPRKR